MATPYVFPIDAQGKSTLSCPKCGLSREIDASAFLHDTGPYIANCQCGEKYSFMFEYKAHEATAPAAPPPRQAPQAGPVVFPVDNAGQARITCPSCGAGKTANVEQYRGINKPIQLTCPCGKQFMFALDFPQSENAPLPEEDIPTLQPGDIPSTEEAMGASPASPPTTPVSAPPAPAASAPPKVNILVNADGSATLTCPHCLTSKTLDVSGYKGMPGPFDITCTCGRDYICNFDFSAMTPSTRVPHMEEIPTIEDIPLIEDIPIVEDVLVEEAPQTPSPQAASPGVDGPVTFYADHHGNTTIVCPQCGISKDIQISEKTPPNFVFNIDCNCGLSFKAKVSRGKTRLAQNRHPGDYFPLKPGELDDMAIQIFYARGGEKASIICPECGFVKHVNVKQDPSLKLKQGFLCQCEYVFPFKIEMRRNFRKHVNLAGEFFEINEGTKYPMYVKDLSRGGLGFNMQHDEFGELPEVSAGDILQVSFRLDDKRGTLIQREVSVKIVRDRFVGVEFTETLQYDKALGFYLMA